MEGPSSFVSRARTAIHSAASKAEKVFTDINNKRSSDFPNNINQHQSDFGSSQPESHCNTDQSLSKDTCKGKNKGVRPKPIKTKQDWHEKLKNLRLGNKHKKETEDTHNSSMAYAIFDDNLYMMGEREFSKDSDQGAATDDSQAVNTDIIPSSAILKQLAVAVEAGFNYNSMNDLLASSRGSSPVRERASLSISAVKSLVLREDKLAREFGSNEKVLSVIHALLNPEGQFTGRTLSNLEAQTSATSLIKEIRGAPIESFVVKLSEAFGCLKTMQKMSAFWSRVVSELRRLWYEGQYIPGIPSDDLPDLNSCLLYQQLQVFNCCISRKRRHNAAVESLELVTSQDSSSAETAALNASFYARTKSGEPVLRLGADKECDHLTLLETGELVYSPIMQEPPLLTEDVIKETEEFVLRTGSVGAGCSQLLSDMQAFKAANPGCILEDFIRWHSPPDWMENDPSIDDNDTSNGGDSSSVKGQLSSRMQKEGNLWRELWETSKPVPAVRQSPIYDEDLAVEGILDSLDDISPSELFKQLFIVALGSGLAIAESTLSTNSNLIKMFNDCKNYIMGTFQGNIWVEKLDDVCQVYETVESMLLNEDEFLKTVNQADETSPVAGDQQPRNRFKKLTLIFGTGRSKSSPKDSEGSPKTFSIFSKKPPKPCPSPTSDKTTSNPVENDWTIV